MIENPNVICNDCAYCKQNKQLRERLKKTQELELEVRRENTKLKELLKECKYELRGCYTDIGWEDQSLIDKIEQALGEDE